MRGKKPNPTQIETWKETDGEVWFDADMANPGDYFMCHKHDVVTCVLGTGFWKHWGGTFENNCKVKGNCYKCFQETMWKTPRKNAIPNPVYSGFSYRG